MSRLIALESEARGLQECINFLHVIAWKHRMSNDKVAMRGVHWSISACQLRIQECNSAIAHDVNNRYQCSIMEVCVMVTVLIIAFMYSLFSHQDGVLIGTA